MSDPTPQLEALRRQNAALDREGFDLHSLVKAGAALHNEIDLDSVCELLIAMVRERTRVAQVAVLVHDDTTHAVRVVAASNLPELPEGLAFPADDGLLWRMVLAGDPISVVDISGNPRFPEMFHASGIGDLEALTWVPLVTPGHVVGVLTLGKCPDGGHVSPGDLGFVTQLARQAAVAIARTRLYEAATLDALTGLYVRRFITHKLDAEVRRASRYGTPLSLIMCDLDHFKSVNDTYGHPAGDAVLSTVAAVFGKQLRTDIDFAGRYGGEEFLVVLPHTGAEAACVAGERLRSAIERLSIDVGTDAPLKVTASFGLSELDTAGADTAEALVKRADQALYDSKRSGRNRISVRPPPTADGPGADGPGADGPGADGDATA